MNASEFRAQLEEELLWRTEEILFFQNQSSALNHQDANKYRRALILILYSNFEGLCKFALDLYVTAINREGIECSKATHAIAAATLGDVFAALRDTMKKAPEFKNEFPDDTQLHRFARDREFVEKSQEIMGRVVFIPDKIVDTESNLKSKVLRKNLYRLGLPYDQFSDIESDIDMLLGIRNQIAHGATKSGIEREVYERFRDSAFRVMNEIVIGLSKAFSERWFVAAA